MDDAEGLGAGAIDGVLDAFAIRVCSLHRVEQEVFAVFHARHEAIFDVAATAETPGGAVDFFGEEIFDGADRREVAEKRPWITEFLADTVLPSAVRGPVEDCALMVLAVI